MPSVSSPDRVALASSADTEVAKPKLGLPGSLAVMVAHHSLDLYTAKTDESLVDVWKDKGAAMRWPEFKSLNAHLVTPERSNGEMLVMGDEVALPREPPADDGFAAGAPAVVKREQVTPHAVNDAKPIFGATANAMAALLEANGFTFETLGQALVEHADHNINRLAAEQDAVGANTTGLTREVLGGLASSGGFAGKLVHGLERLMGLALQAAAATGQRPEDVLRLVTQSVMNTSVRDVVSGGSRLAEGLGQAAVDSYQKRGVTAAVVETALNVMVGRGLGGVNKEKMITELAEAAQSVAGNEKAISKAAETMKKLIKNETVIEKIAASARAVAPVADSLARPAVHATRLNAATTAIHNTPAADDADGSP